MTVAHLSAVEIHSPTGWYKDCRESALGLDNDTFLRYDGVISGKISGSKLTKLKTRGMSGAQRGPASPYARMPSFQSAPVTTPRQRSAPHAHVNGAQSTQNVA
jgi:hypothetical protein